MTSRTTKGYASAYRADQVQVARVRRSQKRILIVNFAAALSGLDDTINTITSVDFECTAPWITTLSNPWVWDEAPLQGAQVACYVEFNFAGIGNVKVTAHVDGGQTKLNYEFQFIVCDAPIYPSAEYPSTTAPFKITATAP